MTIFRELKAEEIECRIQSIKNEKDSKGVSLLLYKDARVDQRILDETVGAMNWQRRHTRDNANCIVSIWDAEKQQWIEKEDTGTESNTEAAKGLASDSFKRACFNWGIGRELYSAPFIWVTDCNVSKNSKGRDVCYDKFYVSEITYGDNGDIDKLVIRNAKTDRVAWPKSPEKAERKPEPKSELNGRAEKLKRIEELAISLDGVEAFCKTVKIQKLGDLADDRLDGAIKWCEKLLEERA